MKKLNSKFKNNSSRRLTAFRQNNELIRVSLRKIATYLIQEDVAQSLQKELVELG
jgi:hypothetical protein